MGSTTGIEWTDATWNPVTGCEPCSPGCRHCYAANLARRFPSLHGPGPFSELHFHPDRLRAPLDWRKPRRVFVCSMGDLFHADVPNDWRAQVFATVDACPRHTFLCLRKRPERLGEWGRGRGNVHLGVTVCAPAELPKVAALRAAPAELRFLSLEPLLGDVGPLDLAGIGWVIVGGETGPGARRMAPAWVQGIRGQCDAAGVPLFFKGWGTATMPKKAPDYHLLNGREWHNFPTAAKNRGV